MKVCSRFQQLVFCSASEFQGTGPELLKQPLHRLGPDVGVGAACLLDLILLLSLQSNVCNLEKQAKMYWKGAIKNISMCNLVLSAAVSGQVKPNSHKRARVLVQCFNHLPVEAEKPQMSYYKSVFSLKKIQQCKHVSDLKTLEMVSGI